ncbi:MAG: desulfoferrodoxin family protein [Candidatus Pacearchaeota archaeon]
MTNRIFKCSICGNVIEFLRLNQPVIICCGKPMEEITEASSEEEHSVKIENNRVKIGKGEHPMTKEHYIEWIEATDGKEISKVFLKPGEKPIGEFSFEPTSARAFCSFHGLLRSSD